MGTPTTSARRGRLADGRQILYFDDEGSPPRPAPAPDPRPAEPPPQPTQLRRDPLTGDWVTIATRRNTRTFLPPADECPLCPAGRGSAPSEIPASSYDVVVFENRFPSFAGAGAEPHPDPLVLGHPPTPAEDGALVATAPGRGRCEVLCFTSDHDGAFSRLTPTRVNTIVAACAQRTAELSELDGVAQVCCFENRGEAIGVTLHHPHGQIYGYPFVPPRSALMIARAAEHHRAHGTWLLRDVLDAERTAATRVVWSGEQWTAYVPAAARWPVEVHLAPHRDVPDLAALDPGEREELAQAWLELARRCDRYYPGVPALPMISAWHQAPLGPDRPLGRLHLQVFSVQRAPGKLKYLAGSESAMGAWINDVTPEAVADRLREVAS